MRYFICNWKSGKDPHHDSPWILSPSWKWGRRRPLNWRLSREDNWPERITFQQIKGG